MGILDGKGQSSKSHTSVPFKSYETLCSDLLRTWRCRLKGLITEVLTDACRFTDFFTPKVYPKPACVWKLTKISSTLRSSEALGYFFLTPKVRSTEVLY